MTDGLQLASLFLLGLGGGFLSGLLGIGGGIVMLPLLVSLPPAAGLQISLRPAVGITMLQSLSGSLSGILIHRRYRALDISLALAVGGSAAAGSLAGALYSTRLNERLIAFLFAFMALSSMVLLLFPLPEPEEAEPVSSPNRYPAGFLLGGSVGFLSGIIGQGGAFIILPLLIHLLKVPVRTAIGTTVVVSFLSAAAGFLGKWGTNQIPFLWGGLVAAGALLGGQVGGTVSHRLNTATLRRLLFLLVAGSMVRIALFVL